MSKRMSQKRSKRRQQGMTKDEAIKKNPFNPNKGNKSAYCRYLRYNVTGWYGLNSTEVRQKWETADDSPKEEAAGESQTE